MIQAGPPVDTHISLVIEDAKFKNAGASTDGLEQVIGIYTSDRYNNPGSDGTRFYLTAEGGLIDPVSLKRSVDMRRQLCDPLLRRLRGITLRRPRLCSRRGSPRRGLPCFSVPPTVT